jgi:choline dehydrogenase-like flavoprotein
LGQDKTKAVKQQRLEIMASEKRFTYIVVGAGSAGCVVANKLSEDTGNSVLLLEAGPSDKNPMIDMPKGFGKVVGSEKYTWSYQAGPGDQGKTTEETWVRGRVLGGSSAINGLQYQRGHQQDYDDWQKDLSLTGWGWDTIGPIFQKLEDHELGGGETRGAGGPLHVSQNKNRVPLTSKFIDAAGELGVPFRADPSESSAPAISYICANIKNGRRWSAANAFLDPIKSRKNLTIATGIQVSQVLFEGEKAVGVQCGTGSAKKEFFCDREIILCTGAMESPAILQRSGIGDSQHLSSLNIPVVSDSPEVGQNMREHLIYTVQFRLLGDYSQNKEYSGWRLIKHVLHYYLKRDGLLACPAYDLTAFVETQGEQGRADAQLVIAPLTMDLARWEGFHKGIPFEKEPGMSVLGYGLRPQSKGYLKIKSSEPDVDYEVVHNHLVEESDRRLAIGIARYIRKLASQPALKDYVSHEIIPGTQYESDDELLEAYNMMGGPGYHTAGTCRMGVDESSVVDERLCVRGVTGLRVVDLSVFPTLVSGNTNGPVMAVAWQGADLILDDAANKS